MPRTWVGRPAPSPAAYVHQHRSSFLSLQRHNKIEPVYELGSRGRAEISRPSPGEGTGCPRAIGASQRTPHDVADFGQSGPLLERIVPDGADSPIPGLCRARQGRGRADPHGQTVHPRHDPGPSSLAHGGRRARYAAPLHSDRPVVSSSDRLGRPNRRDRPRRGPGRSWILDARGPQSPVQPRDLGVCDLRLRDARDAGDPERSLATHGRAHGLERVRRPSRSG